MWPGFMTSVVQTQDTLCWAVDLHHKMIQKNTLLEKYLQHAAEPQKFEDEVKNRIVFTLYNNRTYRVLSVDWERNPADCFDNNGVMATYGQYVSTRYNVRVPRSNQPLLVAEARGQSIWLIPEMCMLTGLDKNQQHNG
eukprot:comp24212_c2_seq2/m.44499 comp24212_c2_seq2/g.44499  ORF comp24212_c2_seq2/g.44499 comp24212_c2_seq2/m.44499 type:complete len:138 (-) comp24212_c2_seq2:30-443(-)